MTHRSLTRSGLALATACIGAGLPFATSAQPAYGRVLDATPIYEQVAIPQEECVEYNSHTRCKTRTVYEDELVGYDVLYEYQGQQYSQRMAHNPGKRVPIQSTAPSSSYRSNDRASTSSVTPGAKSYGSAAPGAAPVESIEYRANDSDLPIIDLRIGAHPPRPR